MCSLNKNDKEILDDDGIKAYPHGINMSLIKHFDDKDKDVPNSIEEFKKYIKSLLKNHKL